MARESLHIPSDSIITGNKCAHMKNRDRSSNARHFHHLYQTDAFHQYQGPIYLATRVLFTFYFDSFAQDYFPTTPVCT
jgi:hypothetical protein